jgi:hypothetical protein
MNAIRLAWRVALALGAVSLAACSTTDAVRPVGTKADPAACRKKSDAACELAVTVARVGARDCMLTIDKATTSKVGVGAPVSPNSKRFVFWQLEGDTANRPHDEIDFVADIGVYPVSGQDPGNVEFSNPQRTGSGRFRWTSNHSGRSGPAVAYNFLVTRTTGIGPDRQVRVCGFTDPVIYNED